MWCLIDEMHLMSLLKNATSCAFVLVTVITVNLVLLLSYSWEGILEYLASCDTVTNAGPEFGLMHYNTSLAVLLALDFVV